MNLEHWLYTATYNLVPKAALKVREDIEFHVETATRRYQLEGRSELEATEFAIRDLGYPKIAARGFEKTHLTKREMDDLVSGQKATADKIWFSIFWFVVFISELFWLRPARQFYVYSAFTIVVGLQFFLNGFIARKKQLKSYLNLSLILTLTYMILFIAFIISSYLFAVEINHDSQKLSADMKLMLPDTTTIGNTGLTKDGIFGTLSYVLLVLSGLFSQYRKYSKLRKLRFL
jgi:hypothetical protein